MSLLYQRARNSGSCPPSILLEECSIFDSLDGFEGAMNKVSMIMVRLRSSVVRVAHAADLHT